MIDEAFAKKTIIKDVLCITLVYVLAHWFLVVATGTWGDDWTYADRNWSYLYEAMRSSSIPLTAYLQASTWLLQDGVWRVIVFFLYYISTLIFYFFLKQMESSSSTECMLVCMLFCTIPVNDARIQWIHFSYAVGQVLFFLGAYLALRIRKHRSKKVSYVIERMLTLVILLFGYSFLQSTMMLTLPMVSCCVYMDLKGGWVRKEKQNLKKILIGFLSYIDYLLEPFLWYFFDHALFPGEGSYKGVYTVKWDRLIGIILKSPVPFYKTLRRTCSSYDDVFRTSVVPAIAMAVTLVCILALMYRKRTNSNSGSSYLRQRRTDVKHHLRMIIIGLCLCYLVYLPYAIKIGEPEVLVNIWTGGRHLILMAIGMSFLIYNSVELVFNQLISKLIIVCIITMGIICFNRNYMNYQEDYYQQLQIADEMKSNEFIMDNNTFLVIQKGQIGVSVNPTRLNGLAADVLGDERRRFLIGVDGLSQLNDGSPDLASRRGQKISEWMDDGQYIDGIVMIDYRDISRKQLLEQKYYELFDKSVFDTWINSISNIQCIPLTREESDSLKEMYERGLLDEENLLSLVCNNSANNTAE